DRDERYDDQSRQAVEDSGVQQLAASLSKLGCALVPASLRFEAHEPTRIQKLVLPLLIDQPERTEEQCLDLLKNQGISAADLKLHSEDSFFELRDRAFFERIWKEVLASPGDNPDREKIRQTMLPHEIRMNTLLGKIFDEQYLRVLREKEMLRFSLPLHEGEESPLVASDAYPPLLPIEKASALGGFC